MIKKKLDTLYTTRKIILVKNCPSILAQYTMVVGVRQTIFQEWKMSIIIKKKISQNSNFVRFFFFEGIKLFNTLFTYLYFYVEFVNFT